MRVTRILLLLTVPFFLGSSAVPYLFMVHEVFSGWHTLAFIPVPSEHHCAITFCVGVSSTYSNPYSFHLCMSSQLWLIQLLIVTILPTIGCYLQLDECVDLGSICTFHSPLQSTRIHFPVIPHLCSTSNLFPQTLKYPFLCISRIPTLPVIFHNLSQHVEHFYSSSFFVYFPTIRGVRGSPLLSS